MICQFVMFLKQLCFPLALLVIATVRLCAEVEHIYYATDNSGKIMRVDANGENPITIVDSPPNTQIETFTIEPAGGKLYWNASGFEYERGSDIYKAELDGSGASLILDRSDIPDDEKPVRSLWRAKLDGSEIETVLDQVEIADFYLMMAPLPAAEFRILAAHQVADGVLLAWNSNASDTYHIEVSGDLARWSTLQSGLPANPVGVTALLIAPEEVGGGDARFFRVQRK